MQTDAAYFRHQAGLLVDELKKPENGDLLEQFKLYNAKAEGGWDQLESPENLNDPWVQMYIQREHPVFQLTPEQSERWRSITGQFDFHHGTGGSYSIVLVTAQLLLGRVDVLEV